MTATQPKVLDMTDEQIIERCAAAGIKWIPPELPDDCDYEMGFPGSFDMVSMSEMRALLSASNPAAPAQSAEPVSPIGYVVGTMLDRLAREESIVLWHKPMGMATTPVYLAAPQPSQTAAVLDDERAAFEAWADERPYDLPRVPTGQYESHATESAWDGWQARAALPQPVAQPVEQTRALTDAARDVLTERRRQMSVEGWTPEHDDGLSPGVLAASAACYALQVAADLSATDSAYWSRTFATTTPNLWQFDHEWWKPGPPRRMLEKAAAMLLAEMEKVDRTTRASPAGSQPK